MDRFPQTQGGRGSKRWVQLAVENRSLALNAPILAALPGTEQIKWLSPLACDDWAEYRDAGFLERVGIKHLAPMLAEFWPRRGPQWDALGLAGKNVLLVEAKAHVPELCSSGCAAGVKSLARIAAQLDATAAYLGAKQDRADWTRFFYQLANRLAHLQFLRGMGVPAWLVLVNFVGDEDMRGPVSREAWESAYEVAYNVMGLGRRHKLSQWIIEVFPEVRALAAPPPV